MRIASLTLPVFALCAATFAAGCNAAPDAEDNDFSALDSGDAKSDSLNARFRIVGTLSYGETGDVDYSNPPKYRAFKFFGAEGDDVSITVDADSGVPIVWVLDNTKEILAHEIGG